MNYQYPTNDELDAAVLTVLKAAAPGKDPNRRPKGLIAHQVVQRLPDHIGWPLVKKGGVGGSNGSKGAPLAASQAVMFSIKRLRKRGLVRVRYIDCQDMMFKNRYDLNGTQPFIVPSFPVCGLYEFTGAVFLGYNEETKKYSFNISAPQ